MTLYNNFISLFYPEICSSCKLQLMQNESLICTMCRHDLPLTNITDFKKNKVVDVFYGKIEIEKAFSLLFFRKKSVTKNLIQELKYKGNQNIGEFFGDWIGELLKENKEFKDIDFIIPVPIHKKRLKQRGYNQLTKFGDRLSYHLNIPFLEKNLIRITETKTQTLKNRFERFMNLETKFVLKDPSAIKGKHILLIDDVITTGATLEACAREIKNKSSSKISILSIGYTE